MKRILLVLTVALMMAAMMVVMAAPSFAAPNPASLAACGGIVGSSDEGSGGVNNSAHANENAVFSGSREGPFFQQCLS
jgi:hypothetical protein